MVEHWAEAYSRILDEVERDMPAADMADQYEEYERRVEAWKAEHGVRA
mgnify:FL=1